MHSLKDNYGAWALITGASDGIGKQVAIELAQQGVHLILVARRAELLNQLAQDLSAQTEVKTIAEDLSSFAANERVIEATKTLDVGLLFTSAGFGTSKEFVENPLEEELNMIAVNCQSSAHLAHHFGKQFKEKKRGCIVLFSSLVGYQGVPYFANYAATKAFILSLAEGLAVELQPYQVEVMAVTPGPVATGFGQRAHLNMTGAAHVAPVAKDIVKSLGQKRSLKPGFLAKLLGHSMLLLPRSMRTWMMRFFMQRMGATS